MPCWTERKTEINLLNADKELLSEVLKDMNLADIATYQNGKLTISASLSTEKVNEIKRNYSQKVVEKATKKLGWTVKQTAANKYIATRR